MSTGSYNIGSPQVFGEYVSRNWIGDDGKYETVGSPPDQYQRAKWNNFTASEITQISSKGSGNHVMNITAYNGFDTDVSNPTLRSLSSLASDVRRHDFNLGIAIGEGKQTVRLCVDTLKRLGLAALDVKRGHLRDAAYTLGLGGSLKNYRKGYINDLSDMWLELQYGWKPLIQDCYEAAKAFEAIASQPRVQEYKGKGKSVVYKEVSTSPPNYTATARITKRVYSTLELSEDFSITPRQSLGLEDPKQVLWEMLPWSFVVDWFIPIGTYLDCLQNIPTLFGRQRQTVVFKGHAYATLINDKVPYYLGGSSYSTYRKIVRTCGPGTLSVPFPKFKSIPEAMSPLHIANAVALASSRFTVK